MGVPLGYRAPRLAGEEVQYTRHREFAYMYNVFICIFDAFVCIYDQYMYAHDGRDFVTERCTPPR